MIHDDFFLPGSVQYTYLYIVNDRSDWLKVNEKVPGSVHLSDGRSNR